MCPTMSMINFGPRSHFRMHTDHNRVPFIPPRIATHDHGTSFLVHDHVFAVSDLIFKGNLVVRKFIHGFKKSGMIEDEKIGGIEMVNEVWTSDGKKNGVLML
jgi:hypothetical protein